MLKLKIYLFLSKFIPYFKRKMMNKDTMLNLFDTEIRNHINKYPDSQLFNLQKSGDICSRTMEPYIRIVYTIKYQAIDFYIFSEYFENDIKITMSCDFNNCDEEFIKIGEYYKYFRSIDKAKQLHMFNEFKPYIINGSIF